MTTINHNLLVAPHFPDGEIVNAFLIRLLSYSGSHSLATASRRLLNRRPGLDGMPSSLGKFHDELGHLYGDIDALIDKHTEYNFICCGLPLHKFPAQRARLVEAFRGPVRLCRLPLLFSRAENCYLQCPECADLQKKEAGFEFIHRRMGAPFVNVCSIHGILLHSASPQMRLFDAKCQGRPTAHQILKTMELGKRIEFCMENPAGESQYQKDEIVALMKTSGWIGDHKRVHLAEFLKQFSGFFKGAFADERLELMCQSCTHIENAIRALLRSDKALHPEWCVLFRWFVEELTYTGPRSADALRAYVRPCRSGRRQQVETSREAIEAALAIHKTLHATSEAMNIGVLVLGSLCKRYNLDVSWRPKALTPEMSHEIKLAFEKGMEPSEVAEVFGISVTSAYRQLSIWEDAKLPSEKALAIRIEADKAEWLDVVKGNPGFSRNALRKIRAALWMRLHRNVPAWLEAHLPPPLPRSNGKKTSPPKELIIKLNQAVADAVQVCTDPARKRVHISHSRLRVHTGVTPFALKAFVANGTVEEMAEPRSTFVNARISMAMKLVGRPIERFASAAKKAGLRTETVRKALKK
jgi:hypothetical protein